MKILFLTQYYPPESNAPAARVSVLARRWQQRGAQVTVLTGQPNHPEGVIYPGYRAGSLRREQDDGVEVLRVPVYVAPNAGVVKRSVAFGSFCLSASSLGPVLAQRPDVVIATSPQLLVGVAGAWVGLLRRAPFVLEVRDLWPDSIAAVGALRPGHPLIRGLHRIERSLYARADHIVVVSPPFRDALAERGVAPARISVIPNGVDSDFLAPPDPGRAGGMAAKWPGRFVIGYVGTLGMAHDLDTVLDAARALRDSRPEALFVLAGGGARRDALEDRVRREEIDNVEILGRIPRESVPDLLHRCDLSLVTLRDDPVFRSVLPSKIFESMGCARPILLAVDGEARRLVEGAGAGVFVRPGNPVELAAAIDSLIARPSHELRAMGAAGRTFVAQHYDRAALADRYLEILSRLIR